MSFKEKFLFHEIYPPKLSTDVLSALFAVYSYWQHYFFLGLAVTFVPPLLASILTLRFADISYLKTSRLGKYVQRHMTISLSVARIIANFVMLTGAWYHNFLVIGIGLAAIIACWTWGLLLDFFAAR